MQWAASRLILHFVPFGLVTQHVTAPAGFPQIECDAHRSTEAAQPLFTRVRFTCWTAQRT